MSSFTTLTLADGQSTPVNHSFTAGKMGSLADGRLYFQWLDFSVNSGVPIGANRIDLYCRMPTFGQAKKVGGRKMAGDVSQLLAADFVVTLPTLETLSNNTSSGINPQPTHAYDSTFWGKIVRNGRAGTQPVYDLVAFARGFMISSQYLDTVASYSPPKA